MSFSLKKGTTRTRSPRSIEDKVRVVIAVGNGSTPKAAFVEVFGTDINKSMEDYPASILDSFKKSIDKALEKGGDTATAIAAQLTAGGVVIEDSNDESTDDTNEATTEETSSTEE